MQVENGMPLELTTCAHPCLLHAAHRHAWCGCLDPESLPMHALHLVSCLLAAGAAVASHRGHFRVRDFGRVYALPPPQLPPTQLPPPLRRSKRIGHGTLYVAPRHAALADMSNLAAALQ